MSFFPRKPEQTRPPETLTAPHIDFLGEQAGPVEDSLKARFRQMFAEFHDVRSAYLARLSYLHAESLNVPSPLESVLPGNLSSVHAT